MSFFPTKILLATDGSQEAEIAAQSAIQLANDTGSELHVVLVGPSTATAVGLIGSQDEVDREAKSSLEAQVEKAKAGGGMVAQSHFRVGRPAPEIVALAEEIGAGLIVMASRGLGGIRRALMGRVSSSVVRHAHCPVLVVRGEKDEEPVFSAKRILLATDGSREAALAARTAVDLANKTNSQLQVVYVGYVGELDYGYPSYYDPSYTVPDFEYMQQIQENHEQEARKALDAEVEQVKAAGGRVVEAHLSMGSPDAEIVKLADDIGTGLIVMGSRGLGGIKRALIGSVSDSVVRHAHCPVLVVREDAGKGV